MGFLTAVLLVALLVFLHEFGHFIVAKACGVAVPVFSLGFGRRVAGVRFGETDYRISAIPFGGYVRLGGSDPFGYFEEGEDGGDPARGFLRKPIWQRILVILAGPAFNIALPFVVFTAAYMGGEPTSAPELGVVDPGSVGARAGLRPGDLVREIDGKPIVSFRDLVDALGAGGGAAATLEVERGGQRIQVALPAPGEGESYGFGPSRADARVAVLAPTSPAGSAGLRPGDLVVSVDGAPVDDWVDLLVQLDAPRDRVRLEVRSEDGPARGVELVAGGWTAPPLGRAPTGPERWGLASYTLAVGEVQQELQDHVGFLGDLRPKGPSRPAPARLAGVQPGDIVVSVAGQPILSWGDITLAVRSALPRPPGGGAPAPTEIPMQIVRAGELQTLRLTPVVTRSIDATGLYEDRPLVGISPAGGFTSAPQVRQYHPFPVALRRAVDETVGISGLIVERLGMLVTGEAAFDRSLGGPVEMVRQGNVAVQGGIFDILRFMGGLSLSVGVLNLLPVPVFDGGQLLFLVIEAVRGRPVSLEVRERALQLGVLATILLMVTVLVKDVSGWVADLLGRS
jgi:regulator of sigma E protease